MCAYKHFDLNFYFHNENLCPLVYLSLQAILRFFTSSSSILFHIIFCIAHCSRGRLCLAASIWLSCVLGALQLYLQTFGADLETMHCLYGRARRQGIIVGYKTETFGQISLFVDEHFGGQHAAEWQKCGCEISIGEFLRQMVNEKITAIRSCREFKKYLCK